MQFTLQTHLMSILMVVAHLSDHVHLAETLDM